jgi:hypothetical protein
MFISGKCLQKEFIEFAPLKLDFSIFIDKDFELPGFPIIKIGILFIKQTKDVNIFSINA